MDASLILWDVIDTHFHAARYLLLGIVEKEGAGIAVERQGVEILEHGVEGRHIEPQRKGNNRFQWPGHVTKRANGLFL